MHTKGPWKHDLVDDCIVGERYVCKLSNWCITAAGSNYDKEYAELQAEKDANIKLIVAAPDLLEACRAALSFLCEMELPANIHAALLLEKAIKKAQKVT